MKLVRRSTLGLAAACALSHAIVATARATPVPPDPGLFSPQKGIVLKGDIVTMDAKRRVVKNGSIFLQNGKVVAIAGANEALPDAAKTAPSIDTKGVIAPGLIDAHNHLEYDFIRPWAVPALYKTMYDWMGSALYEKAIKYPKRMISTELDWTAEIGKYAEVKAIAGGTTSIQGAPAEAGYTHSFVRNIDFKNFGRDRLQQRSIGIMDKNWRKTEAPKLAAKMQSGGVDAWLVHLAEGVTPEARAEFTELGALGLLQKQTVIIHGIALTAADFQQMASVGAKLIASPCDNYLLYGRTAGIVDAWKAGVCVSIGSDWSPFGSKNLLAELKFTAELNATQWNNYLTAQNLVEMVTVNPATAIGWSKDTGHLEPGMAADVTVFDKTDADPYRSIVRATELNVQLVLVGGEPLHGDEKLMRLLKGDDCEVVFESAGRKKLVDVTTDDKTVPKGQQTFAEIRGRLEGAVRMDPDWLYDHLPDARRALITREDWKTYLKKKYPGLEPSTLDPVVALGDPHYFDVIHKSKNAAVPFDIGKYYPD